MTLDIHKLQRLKNTLIMPRQMITELDGRTVFSETLGYDSPSNSLGGPSYTGLITRKNETWTIPTGPSPSQVQPVSRTEDYAYDYAARLSGWDDASNGENISYDARGNITSRSPRYGSSGTITLTYTGDRLATRKVGTGTAVSFAHDSFARMTTDAESGLSITYNALDLPETVSMGNTLKAKYTYLSDGTKVSALDASGAGLVYRGPFTYRRSSGGTLAFESAPFDSGRLTEAGARYHVTDHLGSVRAVIDGNASTTTYPLTGFYSVDDFAPFGTKSTSSASTYLSLASTGSTVSLRDGFTGQEDQLPDFSIGYFDFGARQYSPSLSRWLVPDPMGEKYYDVSPYAYCAGSPVNFVDPIGHEGIRYIDKDMKQVIETNIIIVTRATKIVDESFTEKKRARIERRNKRIERTNQIRVEQIQTGLQSVYSNVVDKEGKPVLFKFNYFTVSEDNFPEKGGISKYQSCSIEYGIPADTPNKEPSMRDYGKAIAVVITQETTSSLGEAMGPFIRLSDLSPSTVAHEVGHTFGLSHPDNGGFGLMAYPPESLTPNQVSEIWEKAFEIKE